MYFFIFFAFFTPGKQPYSEISDDHPSLVSARDNWWTLDFANALVSPGVNSRGELVPSHGASRRRLGDKLQGHLYTIRRNQVYIWILAYLDLHDSLSYWTVQEKTHESTVTSFNTWLIGNYRLLKSKNKMIRFYMTCFDRSLMDYDPVNNAVDHMINYYCIIRIEYEVHIPNGDINQ
jgi:hypothetical protein